MTRSRRFFSWALTAPERPTMRAMTRRGRIEPAIGAS
jgi:hypothetical protein